VGPSPHVRRDLFGDLALLQHELEDAFAEALLESREVDVVQSVEASIAEEKTEGNQSVGMGMCHEQVSKALRHDEHRRHGALELGEACGDKRAQEVPRRLVRRAAEVTVEGPIEEKVLPEPARDGEDDLAVRDAGQDLLHHSLRPFNGAALPA
jgi:hypothetical protein